MYQYKLFISIFILLGLNSPTTSRSGSESEILEFNTPVFEVASKSLQDPVDRRILTEQEENRLRSAASDLRGYIHSTLQRGFAPGASVAVFHQFEQVFLHEEGLATTTQVYQASVSKPLTSFAVLLLVEQGLVELDRPAADYLPGLQLERAGGRAVTVRHLLQHTSGIPYNGAMVDSGIQIRSLMVPRQVHPAGRRFMYSNSNYYILAILIESVSGQTFPDFMETHVFRPLQMNQSAIAGLTNGAGGLSSSIHDLSNFASMVLNNGMLYGQRFLSPHLISEMWAVPEGVENVNGSEYYALGWRVERRNGRIHSAYHAGLWNNGLTEVRLFPESHSFYVQMANPADYRHPLNLQYRGSVGTLATRYLEILTADL